MPASRSPSPVPAPPIATAPGPRAQGLINIFNQAVRATLDKCSAANFAACFPTAAQYSPDVLENLRGQIVEQLDRTWKTNFDDIMARRNVVQLLNSLDQCVEDARLRKKRAEAAAGRSPVDAPVPLHTLPPSEMHLAHLMPFLQEQAADMESRLAETQAANTVLVSTVATQRAEMEALVRGLQAVVHDLEASAAIMGHTEVQSLSKEIKDLETNMKK